PSDTKLVLTISDDSGKQIRRLELDKAPGLRRVAWNLRGETATQGGRGGAAGQRGAGGGGGGGFGGRGGQEAPLAGPGRYRAVLGKLTGATVAAVGAPQTFTVVQTPQ